MATTITDENFEELVMKSATPVMVDFGAAWCGPCNALAPVVEKLAEEYAGKILIGKVDVDACPKITMKYKIRNIPALIFIKNGEQIDKHVGSISEGDLRKKLDATL